jgi:hypothetical protein
MLKTQKLYLKQRKHDLKKEHTLQSWIYFPEETSTED